MIQKDLQTQNYVTPNKLNTILLFIMSCPTLNSPIDFVDLTIIQFLPLYKPNKSFFHSIIYLNLITYNYIGIEFKVCRFDGIDFENIQSRLE